MKILDINLNRILMHAMVFLTVCVVVMKIVLPSSWLHARNLAYWTLGLSKNAFL